MNLPASRYRRCSSRGWQRYFLHLDGFPFQGQRRIGKAKSERHFRAVARWAGRQGKRRCIRTRKADAQFSRIRRTHLCRSEQHHLRKGSERFREVCERRIWRASLRRPRRRRKTCRPTFACRSRTNPAQRCIPISSFTWLLIPGADFGCREARCDQGFPEVDADGWTGIQRRSRPTLACPNRWSKRN